MLSRVERNPSRRDVRTFGLTVLIGLGVIGLLIWWMARGEETGLAWAGRGLQWLSVGLWLLGTAACAACFASHAVGRLVYIIWMSAAMCIGMVMVPLLLSVIYCVVVPVFSLIRLKDPLRKNLRKEGSYWEPHKPYEPTLERMQHPF